MKLSKAITDHIHPSQLLTLDSKLIMINHQDQFISSIDKTKAHLTEFNYSKEAYPHRAFSVFLFDQNYRLLLQQRSDIKITFPNQWTNSCCSHQGYVENDVDKHQNSVKDAKTRVKHELNIDISDVQLQLISKIIYKAKADQTWSEYELDYIYFGMLKENKMDFKPNPDEVKNTYWVDQSQLNSFLQELSVKGIKLTPWFEAIHKTKLQEWWSGYKQQQRYWPITIESLL